MGQHIRAIRYHKRTGDNKRQYTGDSREKTNEIIALLSETTKEKGEKRNRTNNIGEREA